MDAVDADVVLDVDSTFDEDTTTYTESLRLSLRLSLLQSVHENGRGVLL